MFFVTGRTGFWFESGILSAIFLTGVIIFSVLVTLVLSKILSLSLLKGQSSSFTLELPPYRIPQFGKVIIRSIFDRTLFVLGRAAIVAAPAGIVIWLLANIQISGISILNICANFLDPFAYYLGLDGVILVAFILGFPANEIVLPIAIMAYLSTGTIAEFDNISSLHHLLIQNGWTWLTALCTMLFSLMHWPCSTTCLTVKKETGSFKWAAAAFIIPTLTGIVICFLTALIARGLKLI